MHTASIDCACFLMQKKKKKKIWFFSLMWIQEFSFFFLQNEHFVIILHWYVRTFLVCFWHTRNCRFGLCFFALLIGANILVEIWFVLLVLLCCVLFCFVVFCCVLCVVAIVNILFHLILSGIRSDSVHKRFVIAEIEWERRHINQKINILRVYCFFFFIYVYVRVQSRVDTFLWILVLFSLSLPLPFSPRIRCLQTNVALNAIFRVFRLASNFSPFTLIKSHKLLFYSSHATKWYNKMKSNEMKWNKYASFVLLSLVRMTIWCWSKWKKKRRKIEFKIQSDHRMSAASPRNRWNCLNFLCH